MTPRFRRPAARRHARRVFAAMAFAALATACRTDIVVRVWTRVHEDGAVSRRLEVLGRRADESEPAPANWLETEAGIHLARPEAWARRDAGPGRLSAEGAFPSVRDIPPSLAFDTDAGLATDGSRASLLVEDLVVLRHWAYSETYADPFGPSAVSSALDRLLGMASEALRDELRRQLGDQLDTTPADTFVKTEVRALANDLLSVRSRIPGRDQAARRDAAWAAVLNRHGIAAAPSGEGAFWKAQQAGLIDWSRRRLAAVLSRRDAPVTPADLSFWPTGDDWEDRVREVVERVFGSEEEFQKSITPSLRALTGYYGDQGSPRYRFEPSIEMPGRLLATNGTPGREGVFWFLRDEDLGSAGRALEVETVTLDDEKLKSLGARREFEPAQLVELVDILARRDPDGALKTLLAKAVEKGRLAVLREKGAVPSELELLVRELADALDPAVPVTSVR